jgi:hypothetical protein
MAKVLTRFSQDQMVLLEGGLADGSVRARSPQSHAAMLELAEQGLFERTLNDEWRLTDRGRLVAEGVQRQGIVATQGSLP